MRAGSRTHRFGACTLTFAFAFGIAARHLAVSFRTDAGPVACAECLPMGITMGSRGFAGGARACRADGPGRRRGSRARVSLTATPRATVPLARAVSWQGRE